MLWTEKYRPKELEDIVGHEQIIEELKRYVLEGSLPHLLFYGEQAGTGKTSTAIALKNELNWDMTKLNGSDERRLTDFRGKIKKALRHRSLKGKKIVFIDEAGELTSNVQRALKSPMETYSSNATVIFATNHVTRIDSRIKDRCYVCHFEPVKASKIATRLREIARKEGLTITDEKIATIAENAEGSVRKAIQLLKRSQYQQQEKEAIRI